MYDLNSQKKNPCHGSWPQALTMIPELQTKTEITNVG
jgi:hypothetical protein